MFLVGLLLLLTDIAMQQSKRTSHMHQNKGFFSNSHKTQPKPVKIKLDFAGERVRRRNKGEEER